MSINIRTSLTTTTSLCAAVLTALTVAACSSGGGKSLPGPQPQATPAGKTTAKAPQGPQSTELDGDSGDSSNQRINNDPPSTTSRAKPTQQSEDHPESQTDNTPSANTQAPGDGEVVMDPRGLTPKQIFASSDAQGPAHLGARAKTGEGEPLFYSGAAQDFLHDQLSDLVNTVKDKEQADLNHKFAQEVGLSTFEVNWTDRAAKLSLTIRENGKKKNVTLTGKLDNSAKLKGSDGTLSYEAACVDADGGCHTTVVRLKKRVGNKTAIAHTIIRLTNAYLYIEGNPPRVSNNPEYDNLMNLLLNTVHQPGSPDSVQALAFYTSETIGGSSDFAILMRLGIQDPNHAKGDAQVLGLMGPLVKHSKETSENVHIANPPTEATVVGNRTFLMPTVVANTISDIRMVRNDGRGNLQFNITIRKGSARSSEDTIRLTIARLQEQTRSL